MPKLTKRFIDKLEPLSGNVGKDLVLWDDDIAGFGVRVKPSGIKSYIIQYRDGRQSCRMTLGRHGVLTPDEARKAARIELGKVAKGGNPARDKKSEREAPTMREFADDYMERHAIPNKRPQPAREDRSMLDRIVLPKLGARKVKDVSRRDVETLLLSMKETPYKGNRVRALLSKMFSLAVGWCWRADNPVTGIPKFQEHKRDRWLRNEELARLGKALDESPNQRAANLVRLLLLTGARRGEAMTATWDQFDMKRGVWTKPAHTTKQKRIEHVPLSSQAVALLAAIREKADAENPYVFPGNAPDMPINDIKRFWASIRTEAGLGDVRLHDLRHTYASHLVSAGESLAIVGRLLGHTQPQTTQRYAHLADDPLRAATMSFGAKFDSIRSKSSN